MKINRFAIIAFIATLLISTVVAGCTSGSEDWNQKTLRGTVTDSVTGAPLKGVNVTVEGLSTTTDANGNYSLTGFTPANYTLTATTDGYARYQATIAVREEDPTTYDFTMDKQ